MSDSTTFKAAGRDWSINWTMSTSRRLAAIGVNVTNAVHIENLLNLFNDRYKQVDAIWSCIAGIAGKAAELGVTKEQFEDSLGGSEIESAFNAMVAAFIRWNAVDVQPAMREAVTEYYREVRKAADEFIAEMNAPPTPTTEVVAA